MQSFFLRKTRLAWKTLELIHLKLISDKIVLWKVFKLVLNY